MLNDSRKNTSPRPLNDTAAWSMFTVLLLAYSVNAMDRMIFPVLLTDIRDEYHFSLSAAGLHSTIFALGMGMTGIPLGVALQRFGRKPILVTGTVLFSVATLLTVVSIGFTDMLAWRVLSGIGEAMQLGAILTVASTAFPRRRGLAIGAVNTAFALGSVVGPVLGVALLERFHTWRAPMIAFAVIGVALAALAAGVVSPRLTDVGRPAHDDPDGSWSGGALLRNRNTWLLAAMAALFGLIDFAYIGMYATFLREHHGFSASNAGLAVSLSGLAAFASPLGGWLTDRVNPARLLSVLCIAQAVSGAMLFAGPASFVWQCAWSLLFGLIASGGLYVALATSMVRSVAAHHASLASGLFITCIYVAAAFAGLLYSRLVGTTSWTVAGLLQITGLSTVCAVLTLLLKRSEFGMPSKDPMAIAPKGNARADTTTTNYVTVGPHSRHWREILRSPDLLRWAQLCRPHQGNEGGQ
ncbi:MFS transporter [Nocardia sp. NPDC057030]|uniref:MFS transporter n=1 Tax=unclassified Nocardia TaxID=2637762 RepID=UPI00362A8461